MEKHILEQYADAAARTKILRRTVERLEIRLKKIIEKEYIAADSVSLGKKGKKPLGRVTITGFPDKLCGETRAMLAKRKTKLQQEEQELLELMTEVEEYIAGIQDVEIRNILTLYYIDDLSWQKVAGRMNVLYKRRHYTDNGCRLKHDRFLKKK